MDKEEKVAHVNGRYLAVIAIIGLIGTLVSLIYQGKKEETQQQIAQPNINVINEIKIDNNAQNNNGVKSSNPKTEEKITSPEQVNMSEPTKIDTGSKRQYSSEVKDENGNGVANVEIHCPNCIVNKVRTNESGIFQLEGYFEENTSLISTIRLSKDKKSKSETINWREKSPEPINF